MTSQVFKKKVPINILYDLLDKISLKKKNYYVLNEMSFKKAKYEELLIQFCDTLSQYYHNSKQFYITRDLVYNKFITIIRQLCKVNSIPYTSNIMYDKSSYFIYYYIYF